MARLGWDHPSRGPHAAVTPPTVSMNEVSHLGCHQLSGDDMGEAVHVVPYHIWDGFVLWGPRRVRGVRFFALLGLGPAEPCQNFFLPGGSREPDGG